MHLIVSGFPFRTSPARKQFAHIETYIKEGNRKHVITRFIMMDGMGVRSSCRGLVIQLPLSEFKKAMIGLSYVQQIDEKWSVRIDSETLANYFYINFIGSTSHKCERVCEILY